jgi:hypothetical protein
MKKADLVCEGGGDASEATEGLLQSAVVVVAASSSGAGNG